ncbi:hypothetical protein [Massilia sp. TN1-12]|uniref:hypothetical protein n=1 Tax=Massilia paldalensis TaxID=3377675 RepID=UPI00384F690E
MTTTATKSSDYKHIAVWGRRLGSMRYYIVDQQERALAAGAPINAIYNRYASDSTGPTREWVLASEIKDDELREFINSEAAKLK